MIVSSHPLQGKSKAHATWNLRGQAFAGRKGRTLRVPSAARREKCGAGQGRPVDVRRA